MCQYLYAGFSLKAGPADGLTAEQAAAVACWREVLIGIASEEMLHLALVFNVMTAIGAAPPLGRPNFPRRRPRQADSGSSWTAQTPTWKPRMPNKLRSAPGPRPLPRHRCGRSW